MPAVARPLLEDPAAGSTALVAIMAEYWARALAPWWDLIRAVLEADIRQRARHLRAAARSSCSPACTPTCAGTTARCRSTAATSGGRARGRGLQLVPAAFGWPRVGAMFDPPWQPALIYPPRGVGELWAPRARRATGRARRAARPPPRGILVALGAEATTTELAERLRGPSPAGVSEHLGVLRRAGLVRARRDGRAVLYSRTAAGEQVLRARRSEAPAGI